MAKYESPYAKPKVPLAPQVGLGTTPQVRPSTAPDPNMLGTGMAAQAGKDLKGRKSRIDRAIEEATR